MAGGCAAAQRDGDGKAGLGALATTTVNLDLVSGWAEGGAGCPHNWLTMARHHGAQHGETCSVDASPMHTHLQQLPYKV